MLTDVFLYAPMFVTLFWAVTLLMSERKQNPAKHFLGIFMFVAFLVYVSHVIFFKEQKKMYVYIDPVYTFASLMVYPLYYVYIRMLSVDAVFKKKYLMYFLPAALLAFMTLLLYLMMNDQERLNYINRYFFHHNTVLPKEIIPKLLRVVYFTGRIIFSIQVIYFLWKGTLLIKKYHKKIANFYSNLEGKSLLWANYLLISFVITSLMSIIFNYIGKSYFLETHYLLMIPAVIFSTLLYFIGYEGQMQNHTVLDLKRDEAQVLMPKEQLKNNKLKQSLLNLFENQKVYKNPDLKITEVSGLLFTNRTYLSNLINQDFNCSFNDFVNKYRIQEAKNLINTDKNQKFTLEYIGEQSGFGSLHTFIRMFKKFEKTTPGAYRKNYEL